MKKLGIWKVIIGALIGGIAVGFVMLRVKNKVINQSDNRVRKFKDYYYLLNQWLALKNDGKSVETFFVNKGIKSIAIYGMGELGNRLYEELKDRKEVEVRYAIDKNADNTYSEVSIVTIEDELKEVDAIIITAIFDFDPIVEELSSVVDYALVSLEDVIFEV